MAHSKSNNPGGGKPDKIVRDALLAALRQDPSKLKTAAENAWLRAAEDNAAFKEIADRLDGKAVQPLSGDPNDPIQIIQRIERVIVDGK